MIVDKKNAIKTTLDIALFNHLFDAHFEEMCSVVFPILHDRERTRDVVQDVYLSLWNKRATLSIHSTWEGYLYRACILRAIDETRHLKMQTAKLEVVRRSQELAHNPVEEGLHVKQLQRDITAAIGQLEEPTKTIFVLKRYSQLKNREIARELDISIKTVEKHMTRALKHMRQALHNYLNE